ncbi:O-succinylbenzoic acid--CoA ligase [Flexibacter flexilis DSM 6793]|uniref:O-succinylbenzoic acid--CoA ligase n=1 Tax=Flexibacter flexilis DSM 6793 TaxID=927664 RepID=A0A1I1IGD8_9BACT|nr:AMP-binding protein [Flexibacter flexilis]SFC32260.1 O-succinylbenzoic acid--CoA ligase [Flexibacter flexilis DSM 6793]
MFIHFNKKKPIAFAEIEQLDLSQYTDYEQNTLRFCRDWLSGKEIYTLHTSGSTGQPKAWQISRKAMQASVSMTAQYVGLKPQQKAFVCLNTAYIAGTMMLVRCLEVGMEMYVVPPSSNPLADFDADFRFDFAALVPLQVRAMLTDAHARNILQQSHANILVGGTAIDQALESELVAMTSPRWLHTYGMTETVSHIALRRLNGTQASQMFEALPNVILRLGERSCLCISAPTTDYKELITNDIVELSADGKHFVWLGRADNIINSGGVKVQAEKVEKALQQTLQTLQLSCECFVVGLPHAILGECVTAFLELSPALSQPQIMALKTALGLSLSVYEMPKEFVFVPVFQRTATDKVARQDTVKKYLGQ